MQSLLVNQSKDQEDQKEKKLIFESIAQAELFIESMVYKLTGQKIDKKTHSLDEVHYLIALAFKTIDDVHKANGLVIKHQKPDKPKKLF